MNALPPWGLAAAARESLLYGNEHRTKRVDDRALRSLMQKFNIAADIRDSDAGTDGFFLNTVTPLLYEQVPWQEPMFAEVSRSHAWLIEGLGQVETEVVTEEVLAEVVGGMPLRQAIGATFLLQVGAVINEGRYDPGWLDQPNFADVLHVYPRSDIETVVARLTTTRAEYKAQWEAHSVGAGTTSRFDYNPLVNTPLIDMGHEPALAPAPRFILRTATPGGLYYAGIAAYGQAFTRDLGVLFEHYVGRHLQLIHGAQVIPEFRYGRGGGQKSVDWFVVMPGLVLLIEAKSRRLGPAAQAGGPALIKALADSLTGARKQLARTVENLSNNHPSFSQIPRDRPMLALIVTAEPFYTGPAFLVDHDEVAIPGGKLPDVPVTTASAREIELMVTHGAGLEALLLDEIGRRGSGVVGLRDICARPGGPNPILEDAWASYPWPDAVLDEVLD